jgi:hypothetical protein
MTMTMTSGPGGPPGGSQGGREFSLTASLANLPGRTSKDGIQGGKARQAVNTRKSRKTWERSTPHGGPSLPVGAGNPATTVSRWVTNPQRGPGRDEVTVHVPVELPSLTTPVNRALLAILIELTAVEILDTPPDRRRNDR